jgi:hypothetical protein
VTAPFTGRRGRSAAVTSRESRTLDARQAACAQMLMVDAIDVAAGGREGLAAAKQWVSVTGTSALRGMSTADRAATGVGIGIAAAVGIAGIVVTGGLAIPVLIAIGAGTYALKKLIQEIGNDRGRRNRNWLARYNGASEADNREEAALLSCEAGDALRRAVDHYRMMKTTIIPLELKKYEDVNEYGTCEDAINHVKAVARFIHHGDKVRNYVLPCIDACIFYLKQYKEMNDTWTGWEPSFKRGLELWFMEHPAGACSANEADVCYAPRTPTGALPMRPKDRAKSGWTLPIGAPAPETGAIDIKDLIEAMEFAREKIYQGMHVMSDTPATYNSSSEARSINRVRSGSPAAPHMARARTQAMIDAVWRQVDRPNYFNRTTRRISHWYTRNNKTEKAAAVFSTVTDIGSVFMPFLKGVDTISSFAKSAISAGVSAGTAGANLGMGALQSEGRPPMSTAMLNQAYVQDKAKTDVRGTGAAIQKLMPELLSHFSLAATAVKDLQTVGGVNIASCKTAFGLSARVAEVIHEMNKVSLYLMPCIGMTDYVAAAAYSWSLDEDAIWVAMEKDVSAWVATGDHAACREAGCVCYGPKYHQQGGGIFSRTAVTWHLLTESTPHKPLT